MKVVVGWVLALLAAMGLAVGIEAALAVGDAVTAGAPARARTVPEECPGRPAVVLTSAQRPAAIPRST